MFEQNELSVHVEDWSLCGALGSTHVTDGIVLSRANLKTTRKGEEFFTHWVVCASSNDTSVYRTVNLLKPTGHVMQQQFNIEELYALPTLYLCVLYYLRTNSDLCHLQHKLIGFYNWDEKCLQRVTNWVFK